MVKNKLSISVEQWVKIKRSSNWKETDCAILVVTPERWTRSVIVDYVNPFWPAEAFFLILNVIRVVTFLESLFII